MRHLPRGEEPGVAAEVLVTLQQSCEGTKLEAVWEPLGGFSRPNMAPHIDIISSVKANKTA